MKTIHLLKMSVKKLLVAILPIQAIAFSMEVKALDNDTVQISDPLPIDVNHTKYVAYSSIAGSKLAIANWDDIDPSYSNSIYQIDILNQASPFITDSFGTIDRFTFLGDKIYTIAGGAVKGFDCNTKEMVFFTEPYYACALQGGITSAGDSLIFTTDPEWDHIYKINVNTQQVETFESEEWWSLWSINYDEYNNRVLAVQGDSQIISIDLAHDYEISLLETNFPYWFHHFLGLATDKWGNIFTTNYDTNGVFMLDETINELIKITDIPENPGYLYYDKEGNYLLVPDLETFDLYTIWLNGNPNSINSRNIGGYPEEMNMVLYPNPADNYFTVSFTLNSPATGIVDIIDINGRVVKTYPKQAWHDGKNIILLERSDQAGNLIKPGTYIVVISDENMKQSQRIVLLDSWK
jgi:hypothetical protein